MSKFQQLKFRGRILFTKFGQFNHRNRNEPRDGIFLQIYSNKFAQLLGINSCYLNCLHKFTLTIGKNRSACRGGPYAISGPKSWQ